MTRRQENEFLKRMEAAKSNNIIVPEKMTLSSEDRKSTRLNSSHLGKSRMPSSA